MFPDVSREQSGGNLYLTDSLTPTRVSGLRKRRVIGEDTWRRLFQLLLDLVRSGKLGWHQGEYPNTTERCYMASKQIFDDLSGVEWSRRWGWMLVQTKCLDGLDLLWLLRSHHEWILHSLSESFFAQRTWYDTLIHFCNVALSRQGVLRHRFGTRCPPPAVLW